MSLLGKLLNAVFKPDLEGIKLNLTEPYWELSGETDFPRLLAALPLLLPEGCVLYLEGGYPEDELLAFLQMQQTEHSVKVACGTVWPKPRIFHLPATPTVLQRLSELTHRRAAPELAAHFHIYRGQVVFLEWHDVFTQPALISGTLNEEIIANFARVLSMEYRPGIESDTESSHIVPGIKA